MIRITGKLSILLGLCFIFAFSSQTFANEDDILQKQREIDQYLFEENNVELEEKGIYVTYTRPFGDAIEIGISPYTEEHAGYLYEELGKDNINVVSGESAETFTSEPSVITTDAEKESTGPSYLWVYVLVVVSMVGGGVFLLKKKK